MASSLEVTGLEASASKAHGQIASERIQRRLRRAGCELTLRAAEVAGARCHSSSMRCPESVVLTAPAKRATADWRVLLGALTSGSGEQHLVWADREVARVGLRPRLRRYALWVLVGQLVLFGFCAASIVGIALLLTRLLKRADVRHDLQCRIYLARRISKVAFVAGSILLVLLIVFIGAAVVESGLFAGWGLVAMASLPLLFLAFYIYLARLPFTYPDDL